jgi:hypothetical protein
MAAKSKGDCGDADTGLRNGIKKFFRLADMSVVYKDQRICEELPEIVPFLKVWKFKANALRFLHILLGSLSVVFSVLTTTFVSVPGFDNYSKYFAFFAAVSIGLLTAFDLGTKSNNMMNAWRQLMAAVIKFNQQENQKKDVIIAYIEGEKLIGNVTFQQQGTPSNPPSGP